MISILYIFHFQNGYSSTYFQAQTCLQVMTNHAYFFLKKKTNKIKKDCYVTIGSTHACYLLGRQALGLWPYQPCLDFEAGSRDPLPCFCGSARVNQPIGQPGPFPFQIHISLPLAPFWMILILRALVLPVMWRYVHHVQQ